MLDGSMMEAAVIQRPPTSSKQQGACGHVTEDANGGSRQSFLIGTGTAQDAEDCCRQAFHPSMVASGLSQLGRSATGSHQVYQTLKITHTDLQDPQAVAHCRHIQQLLLLGNCLTSLQPLSSLQHLTSIDVSHNRLSQVLDYGSPDSGSGSSNLRKADLSYNRIDRINPLGQHSNLQELVLAGNHIWRIGRGLEPCRRLRKLDLSNNRISSCRGLQGLCSLHELSLDGNRLSSLQPLSSLTSLQVLSAAHNNIGSLDGIQGLSSLRVLDVGGNQLRRVEVLAACRSLSLLTSLNVSGNPLTVVQDARLHVVNLLTQLQQLNGVQLTLGEKVEAANMVGAAADGLVAIRRRFFPQGGLEDGGGAVLPTAAGLRASHAEEERSCSDAAAMFAAIDRWARSVQPALALQPLSAAPTGFGAAAARASSASLPGALAAAGLPARSSSQLGQGIATAQRQDTGSAGSSRRSSNSSAGALGSRPGSQSLATCSRQPPQKASLQPAQQVAGGAAAIAARLAAGCCPEAPYRQLQLLRACHCWVLAHVPLPKDCDLEAGADAVTWDVGRHLFGETDLLVRLHEALLPGYNGTWAECVSQLLVRLLRCCHLEAVALSGFWKAGGRGSVQPGEQLASHNHSWVAAKVNGSWRLLDPVCALIMAARDQPLPFFLPPEAFIHTHLPFEPCWQLLPQPVRAEAWWAGPGLSLGFAAVGGRLLDGGALSACTVVQLDREALVWPVLDIPVAAPVNPQQRLCTSLLDGNMHPLARWEHGLPHLAPSGPSLPACQEPVADSAGAVMHMQQEGSTSSTGCEGRGDARGCLVFQQQVLGPTGALEAQVGPCDVRLAVQQLWAAFPGPGTFFVKVEQVMEVPGGLMPAMKVEGLQQPLSLTLRQHQEVLQLKVVVRPADAGSSTDSSTSSCFDRQPLPPYLPQPQPASAARGHSTMQSQDLLAGAPPLQLLAPQPGTLLEVDRVQQFEVLAPAWADVAVGTEQSGWAVLQLQQQSDTAAAGCADATEADAAAGHASGLAVFAGGVLLPRVDRCFVAVREPTQPDAHGCSSCGSWVPVLGLHVWPPVQALVPLQEQQPAGGAAAVATAGDVPPSPAQAAAVHLLRALDVDGDGAASRRDMLRAFRRDRQLADHLKMPARIRAGDGTFDAFLSRFITINRSGLGLVNSQELAAYLAALPAGAAAGSSGGCSRVATAASSAR